MKIFVVTLLFLLLAGAGVGAYFYFSQPKPKDTTPKVKQSTVLNGTVMKVSEPNGGDYTHLLQSSSGLVGLNSYSIKLDQYENKKVEVTGQYSGTTLYVDSVVEK